MIDNQSVCHCSKTRNATTRHDRPFDNQSVCHCSKTDYVALAMTEIVDELTKLGGERVSSFSNGVTSFSFDVSKSDESALYDEVARILPVEMLSRCVCV